MSGASYEQVAERGSIAVMRMPHDFAQSRIVRNEFNEEMTHLARAMSKTRINGEDIVNKALLGALLVAFRSVAFETLMTKDQINSRVERKECMVFALRAPEHYTHGDAHKKETLFARISRQCKAQKREMPFTLRAKKPQKGRLVLKARDGGLCIPVMDEHAQTTCFIPFPLTADNVKTIGGHIGKNISEAYAMGIKDIERRGAISSRRALREEDATRRAKKEIDRVMHGQKDTLDL